MDQAGFGPTVVAVLLHVPSPLAPATLVRGVQKLSAGSWCEYDVNRGMAPAEHYWSLLGDPTNAGEASLGGEALERAVEDAVVSHLVADVPVGLFLSGGVDSSLVAAVAAKHTSIDAFTVGTHSPLDESQFASQVASHLGVPLHVCWVTGNDFRDRFEEWCFFNDDPVADPSALALMVVAEHARKSGMKVMLAGEGADELFGGYSSYLRYSAYAFTRRVPLVNYFGSIFGLAASDRDRDYLRSLKDLRFRGSAHVLCDALGSPLRRRHGRVHLGVGCDCVRRAGPQFRSGSLSHAFRSGRPLAE